MSYETPGQSSPPPGWYPADNGTQRYWDGAAWTEHVSAPATTGGVGVVAASTSDETSMAALAHVLGIFFAILGPLIIMLTKGEQSRFVKHHAVEALNFSITVMIASFVSVILMFVLIGFLLFPVVVIGALVLHVMAAIAASRGEWYRYPFAIRLITGPV